MEADMVRDEIIPRLDALLAKMGEGGEFVWATAYRQSLIDGWLWAGIGCAVFAICLASVYVGWRLLGDPEHTDDDATAATFMVLFPGLVAVASLIAVPMNAIPRLLNPDMYALRIVIDTVSRLIP